jgi:hypothetical protein
MAMPTHQKHNPNGVRETAQSRRTSKATDRSSVALAQQPDLLVLQRAVENPGAASPDAILALQGAAGNRAVSNLLVQAKLVVGPVGDRYEQEADRVAEQVMAMPTPSAERGNRGAREQGRAEQTQPSLQRQAEEEEELQMKPLANTITPLVQRQEIPEEEELLQGKLEAGAVQRQELEDEELLQGKLETGAVQRQELEDEELLQGKLETGVVQRQEEEELLQGKSEIRNPAGGFEASDDIKSRLTNLKGNGSPLPDELRADVEARFGTDFSAVRVHADGEAGKLNRDLRARAFTHGSDIYFGAGRYDPDSSAGRRLLAHELTHVVQQTGGRVKSAKSGQPVAPRRTRDTGMVQRAKLEWEKLTPREITALKGVGVTSKWQYNIIEDQIERIKAAKEKLEQEETALEQEETAKESLKQGQGDLQAGFGKLTDEQKAVLKKEFGVEDAPGYETYAKKRPVDFQKALTELEARREEERRRREEGLSKTQAWNALFPKEKTALEQAGVTAESYSTLSEQERKQKIEEGMKKVEQEGAQERKKNEALDKLKWNKPNLTTGYGTLTDDQKNMLTDKFGIDDAAKYAQFGAARPEEILQALAELRGGEKVTLKERSEEAWGRAWSGIKKGGKGLWKGIKWLGKSISAPGSRKSLERSVRKRRYETFGVDMPEPERESGGTAPESLPVRAPLGRRGRQPISGQISRIAWMIGKTDLPNKQKLIEDLMSAGKV